MLRLMFAEPLPPRPSLAWTRTLADPDQFAVGVKVSSPVLLLMLAVPAEAEGAVVIDQVTGSPSTSVAVGVKRRTVSSEPVYVAAVTEGTSLTAAMVMVTVETLDTFPLGS